MSIEDMRAKKYAPRWCICSECTAAAAAGGERKTFLPNAPRQKYSKECLNDVELRRLENNREWAKKNGGERGAKRPAAHVGRTPIKRCDTCADCSWRRPLDGCHTCGRPYHEDVIERT